MSILVTREGSLLQEDLFIEGTPKTLRVAFSAKEGRLSFAGVSLCNNPLEVYKRSLLWLREYAKHPTVPTHVIFLLRYYNTSTSKFLLEVFQILEAIFHRGHQVFVAWQFYSQDMDMEDAGIEFSENTMLPFRIEELH